MRGQNKIGVKPPETIFDRNIDRRIFLKRMSSAALISALHPFPWSQKSAQPRVLQNDNREPLIRRLSLVTTTPLTQLNQFYNNLLGLRTKFQGSNELTIFTGKTVLSFVRVEPEHGSPFYHVAFNIPENKLLTAREWQLKRTPLDPNPRALRDPNYPDDVVHFRHWNAHSLFFWDPAGNLLEYIARHDLDNGAVGSFSSEDILYASEIALIFEDEDVRVSAARLENVLGLKRYRNHNNRFAALGDERGLLLVMKRGVSLRARADVFPTRVAIRGAAQNP